MDLLSKMIDAANPPRLFWWPPKKTYRWVSRGFKDAFKGRFLGPLFSRIALPFLAVFLACSIAAFAVRGDEEIARVTIASFGLFSSGCATAIFAIQSIRKIRNIERATSFSGIADRLAKVSLFLAGVLISLDLYINVFTGSLYEVIPSAIGGPGLGTMQFEIRKESIDEIQKLEIHFSAQNSSLSEPLKVIYESDDVIYVLVSHRVEVKPTDPNKILYAVVARVLRLIKN